MDNKEVTKQAIYYTTKELAERGKDDIPHELISAKNLIYSSPATLAFNSPGAEGFGVKRAGLAVPGSVMLIISPGCCGRNTKLISDKPEYKDRFFYLNMDETDVVTGRHLKKIPKAVEEVVSFLEEKGKKPEVVMLCITCVDALLGTDMERISRKCEEKVDVPVRPCYMYALTREGRKPPMVHVRQSIYSLLEPAKKKSNVVDILGFFAPLYDSSELYEMLSSIGIKKVHEISRCENLAEYKKMAEANFALVLNQEARPAAVDFEEKLGIPSIELNRFYDIDRIEKQYAALGRALGVTFDDGKYKEEAKKAVEKLNEKVHGSLEYEGGLEFSIGECINADPFELALSLTKMGHTIKEIFGTITAANFRYISALGEISPKTKVYSNLHPSMIYYDEHEEKRNLITLGKDAKYYHPKAVNIAWNSDRQPFGYDAVTKLMNEIAEAI
ncbi:MAG: nitrogenase component 1 [Lachnospiraceae bacterium]|nr:nitrogenase component 1 [Lachnospiraceae bacterium]